MCRIDERDEDAGERDVRRDRQVDAAAEDHHHLAEHQHDQDRGVVEHVAQIAGDEERGRDEPDADEQHDDDGGKQAVAAEDAHQAASWPTLPVAILTRSAASTPSRAKLRSDATVAHDDDPVRHAEDFRNLRGDHDDADALRDQLAHESVDRGLRADVDALGRLVQDDDQRLGCEPLADNDLLLIAARKRADLLDEAGRAEIEFAGIFAGKVELARKIEEAPPPKATKRGQGDVGEDGHRQDDALALALLRHVDDAGRHCVGRVAYLDWLPGKTRRCRRRDASCRTAPASPRCGPRRRVRRSPGFRPCAPRR